MDEKVILNTARRIEDDSARESYLQQVCSSDDDLLRSVLAQLRLDEVETEFLEVPPVVSSVTNLAGEMIGPYRLCEKVGEGGMGLVFAAEQTRPVRRRVALKICKPGLDTREVIARFETERQALAAMDHPNIATVLDAGTTRSGRPFFVMELVRGIPITKYCEKAVCGTTERLQLFITVCQAVQHAHLKGVIHRDIKPSNVLVELHDGIPVAKVIDFGVAKVLDRRLTDQSIHTRFSQLVGTPLYMSPEQAVTSTRSIDTRTDVYSLGVLLYELLTATTPFDERTLTDKGVEEFRRRIREDEPLPPSVRIGTLSPGAQSTLATRRGLDARQLERSLRGDLDWIVMKSLEKDRNRRYQSATALADDIKRYLADEEVEARPPSIGYRLTKVFRRHRTATRSSSGTLPVASVCTRCAATTTW